LSRKMFLMSTVKTFRLTGDIKAPHLQSGFSKDIRALNQKDAEEVVYQVLGSRHKLKRYHIKFKSVEEIPKEGD
jgi:large subunit ribosomal protein LX